MASVEIERHEGVATIRVNRPQALNALNRETLEGLLAAVTAESANPEVRVMILTGAGEKAFVAGADIAAMQPMTALEARAFSALGHALMRAIEESPKPVIAAINGFALGGGCELALACDIRLAAENARFGQPEVSLGVTAGFGGTQRLCRLTGSGRGMELLLTGDMIDAAEAYRIGLVNRVVPAAELLEAAGKLAAKIAAKGPVATRLTKEAIRTGGEMDRERACTYEQELFALCFSTADQKEGMAAFLEKRPPLFTGA